jgi:hypothetical protein
MLDLCGNSLANLRDTSDYKCNTVVPNTTLISVGKSQV